VLSKDLFSARERLLELRKKEDLATSEIIIAENVSLEDYSRFRKSHQKSPVRLCLMDGRIIAYEVPLDPHILVVGKVMASMVIWNDQDLEYGPEMTMKVGPASQVEPDMMARPVRRPFPPAGQGANALGAPYPTMIIEVGFTQTFPDLHRKVAVFFSAQTTIQIVLAIKIFELRANNTFAMIAALYLRTSPTPLVPVQVISFGTAEPIQQIVEYLENTVGVSPNIFTGVGRIDITTGIDYPLCNAPGIQIYQMNIPAAELFNGDPLGIPAAAVGGCDLDLWQLQLKVRRGFNL